MSKVIAIDPGISKCGVIVANIKEKKVCEAVVIESNLLLKFVKKKYHDEKNIKFIIGNGTSSKNFIKDLNQLVPNLIITEEKNSTYRAKQRYFEIFPTVGIKSTARSRSPPKVSLSSSAAAKPVTSSSCSPMSHASML